MCRMELGQTSPLVLGASPIADQRCPIGQDAPIYILAWGCLAVLCRVLHGSIENIVNEVMFCWMWFYYHVIIHVTGVSSAPPILADALRER